MEFLIKVVKRRLSRNKSMVALIMVQMALGVALFSLFLNISAYINSEYNKYIAERKDYSFTITAAEKSGDVASLPISREQEIAIRSVDGATISIDVVVNIITFNGKTHTNELGENIFDDYIIRYTTTAEDISASEEFLRAIEGSDTRNTVNYDDIPFSVNSDGVTFRDGDTLPVTIIEAIDAAAGTAIETTAEKTHFMQIPFQYYWEHGGYSQFSNLHITVDMETSDIDAINGILYDIETTLGELNPDYEYVVGSEFFAFMRRAQTDREQAYVLSAISLVMIMIVYTGILSLFILFIEKRTFELSICLTVGAKLRQIMAEFLVEFLFISLVPSVIALAIVHAVFIGGFRIISITVPSADFKLSAMIFACMAITNMVVLVPVFLRIKSVRPFGLLNIY